MLRWNVRSVTLLSGIMPTLCTGKPWASITRFSVITMRFDPPENHGRTASPARSAALARSTSSTRSSAADTATPRGQGQTLPRV